MNRYIDQRGRELFVSCGIGIRFATYYRKKNGSLKRLVSKYLPTQCVASLAQRDLDQWALRNGLREVCP